MQQDKTWGNRIFDFLNHGLLLLIGIVTVIPFMYILAVSFTSPHEVAKGGFILFPKEFSGRVPLHFLYRYFDSQSGCIGLYYRDRYLH